MLKRANIIIQGRVQGVFFRASALHQAQQFNLTGFVRNHDDGNVHAVVEGEEDNIEQFIAWCNNGPEQARVDNVFVNYESVRHSEASFTIIS